MAEAAAEPGVVGLGLDHGAGAIPRDGAEDRPPTRQSGGGATRDQGLGPGLVPKSNKAKYHPTDSTKKYLCYVKEKIRSWVPFSSSQS